MSFCTDGYLEFDHLARCFRLLNWLNSTIDHIAIINIIMCVRKIVISDY